MRKSARRWDGNETKSPQRHFIKKKIFYLKNIIFIKLRAKSKDTFLKKIKLR